MTQTGSDATKAPRRRGVASKRRAGRAVRQRVRAEQRAYLRKNWKPFTVIVIVAGLSAWGLASIQNSDFASGFVVGAFTVGVLSVVSYGFAVQGFVQRDMGGTAEQWTTDALRKLPRRSWAVVDDITFEKGNVDHVVVGPGRLYAVETKWMSGSGPEGSWARRAAAQAEENASRIGRLLRSSGLEREVVPVLVVWGRGAKFFEGRREFFGSTRVVAGYDAEDWRARMENSAAGEFDSAGYEALVRYAERRLAHQRSTR